MSRITVLLNDDYGKSSNRSVVQFNLGRIWHFRAKKLCRLLAQIIGFAIALCLISLLEDELGNEELYKEGLP